MDVAFSYLNINFLSLFEIFNHFYFIFFYFSQLFIIFFVFLSINNSFLYFSLSSALYHCRVSSSSSSFNFFFCTCVSIAALETETVRTAQRWNKKWLAVNEYLLFHTKRASEPRRECLLCTQRKKKELVLEIACYVLFTALVLVALAEAWHCFPHPIAHSRVFMLKIFNQRF